MNEAEIIAGCRTGNRQAQKKLFDSYSKGMLSLCKRYVKDEPVAEEMLLNGFLKFFQTIERFHYQDGTSIGKWLKAILVNECLMYLRNSKRISFAPVAVAEDCGMDAEILDQLHVQDLLQVMEQLPDGYRVVFNMFVVEGFSHREIAEQLGITEGTSKSQLSRAKVFLQNLLQKNEMFYEK